MGRHAWRTRLRPIATAQSGLTRRMLLSGACSLLPAAAFAHPGHDSGFLAGMLHPLTGLDHLLAMLAVGWWATQLGGTARLLLPSAFVMALLVGVAVRPLIGPAVIEAAILSSVIALGAAVVFRVRPGLWVSTLVVAGCAWFHGLAHGLSGAGAPNLEYATGVSLTSAVVLVMGIAMGTLAHRLTART